MKIATNPDSPHGPQRLGGRAVSVLLALGALGLALGGCGPREGTAARGPRQEAGHAHRAPHGGTLVELGDHKFNLEFVFDEQRGVLQAYFLDAHAEAFVRVSVPEFVVTAIAAGKRHLLLFKPVANPVTGEAPGNTSLFEAEAAWLGSAKAFDGTLQAVNVRSIVFTNIRFRFSLVQIPDDPWAKKKK